MCDALQGGYINFEKGLSEGCHRIGKKGSGLSAAICRFIYFLIQWKSYFKLNLQKMGKNVILVPSQCPDMFEIVFFAAASN